MHIQSLGAWELWILTEVRMNLRSGKPWRSELNPMSAPRRSRFQMALVSLGCRLSPVCAPALMAPNRDDF